MAVTKKQAIINRMNFLIRPTFFSNMLTRTKGKVALIASAKYLAEHYEAISIDDVDQIIKMRDMRNRIAHDLPTVLVKEEFSELIEFVEKARDLVFKLDNFWIIRVGRKSDRRPHGHPEPGTVVRMGNAILWRKVGEKIGGVEIYLQKVAVNRPVDPLADDAADADFIKT